MQLVQWRIRLLLLSLVSIISITSASIGDRLPEFKECVAACIDENCAGRPNSLPLGLRLLFWTCPANCDYNCQHAVTAQRRYDDPPVKNPVVQYHGKWPFYRFIGVQEPASVLFSLMNLWAHRNGLAKIRRRLPRSFPMRKYYLWLGSIGTASWVFSAIFHTRDFNVTEKLDYFAAAASVFYGLFYTPIRVFKLYQESSPTKGTVLQLWTLICAILYLMHLSYLTFWSWDYTYNMAANVVAGILQNALWTLFSYKSYQKLRKPWAAWPGMIVAWIILAMSLELLDFPPILGIIDAHSLWHLGTVVPTIWWYNFLIKDAQQEVSGDRLKA